MNLQRLQKIAHRLAHMDRAEFRDRLRQEAASRQDAVLACVGHDFAHDLRGPSATAGKFFFATDDVDPILKLLRQHLPGDIEKIIHQAEQICEHRFDLLGYRGLDFGSPIDWHFDPVHGKRAPRKAFYRIRYLDFAQVGDSKITWELNRHQHLVTLAKAYRLTGNRHFADEMLRQWRHWWAENPYPMGINWASSLEAAFRSLSWLWAYHVMQGAPGIPNLRHEWLRGLALHGRHIERHLSTYFSPNTHLLGEGVALFFLGVLCPELAAAQRWNTLGWRIILQEAERQVRRDGFHFEQSTYYHVYALDFFLHAAVLAGVNGIQTPKSLEDTIERMLSALALLGRGGAVPRFGDDDGGRLFDPQRNRGEHLLDPLSTGAVLFNRGDLKKAAGSLREETLWLLGPGGLRLWEELTETPLSSESASLTDAGFYLLPGGPSTQLVVDAGPLGTQSGGHGHADALSVTLQSDGHSLLIDPGTFEYVGPGPERNLLRGTPIHNTLTIDRSDQARPATAFSWDRLTETSVERWVQGKSFDLLAASHDGYRALEFPVSHRRQVVSFKNGLYLIRDVVEGPGVHYLDLTWHLGPTLEVSGPTGFRSRGSSTGLALLAAQQPGWTRETTPGSWSPAYGVKEPASVVVFSADATLPTEFATLLVTLKEPSAVVGSFTRLSTSGQVAGYSYSEKETESCFFFATRGQHWSTDSFSSDAEFVCWKRSLNGCDELLMFCGGSYAQVKGVSQLRSRRLVEWAELIVTSGARTAYCSDMAALEEDSFAAPQPDSASPIVK
jgi:hypothetical protein